MFAIDSIVFNNQSRSCMLSEHETIGLLYSNLLSDFKKYESKSWQKIGLKVDPTAKFSGHLLYRKIYAATCVLMHPRAYSLAFARISSALLALSVSFVTASLV